MKILLLLIFIIIIISSFYRYEYYSLPELLKLYPRIGKFDDNNLIIKLNTDVRLCKRICNFMTECEGVSYMRDPFNICNLYYSANKTNNNPFFLSFRK